MTNNGKLNDEIQEQICDHIRHGNYAKVAAQACDIDEATYYLWIKKGKESKSGKYYKFYKLINKAKADFESKAVQKVSLADPKWVLERSRDGWVRRDNMKIEHSGKISFVNFKELMKEGDE